MYANDYAITTDLPKVLKRDCNTILICCSRRKGFGHLFTFTIKALTCTNVPARLAHFTHSASIIFNRKTQRSLIRGRGTSILSFILVQDKQLQMNQKL